MTEYTVREREQETHSLIVLPIGKENELKLRNLIVQVIHHPAK